MPARPLDRLATVRVRLTVAAVVIVGLALLLGSIALVVAMRRTLTNSVRDAAELRAADVSAVFAERPDAPLRAGGDEDSLAQVVDADGRVVSSSPNMTGEPAVATLEPGESARIEVPFEDDTFIAVADTVTVGDSTFTVLVARTTELVDESTGAVIRLLVIGLPVLVLVVAATTWRLVGRALAPVDAMRLEVDGISAAQLHRRVPAPPGADEISRLARTMNGMLERLERAQLRQRRFIADASHELRSPVASIRQHAEVALAHPERTSVRELAETVLAEDLRVGRLVDDLLLVARAEEQTLDLARRPVDVDDLVLEEARRLRATTSHRIDTGGVSAGRVSGNARALRQVIRNVADNAARHARSTVTMGLADDGARVRLTVDDDGPGIPAAERERVFERFVRLDDSRDRDAGGSGLGLAIVAELVAAHGGSIAVAESPSGGARFEITLPSLPDPA